MKAKPKLKIAQVSDSYYPAFGGVAEHLFYLSQELRKRGHIVKIITTSFGERDHLFTDENVIRIGHAIQLPFNKSTASITVGYKLLYDVRKIIKKERFDILHLHGPFAPTLPLVALMVSDTINIATFHTYYKRSLAYNILRPFFLKYLPKLHGKIAVSQAALKATARYFPDHYIIIPNGVDIERFKQAKPLEKFKEKRPTILFLGRFDARKGLVYLLRAFPKIKKIIPKVRLIIVGDGWTRPYYKTLVLPYLNKSVFFEGFVPPELIPSYYATCDVYCTPAIGAESFGIVLLEAMATKKPIVASDIDGYREVITNGKEGILVPPKDPSSLAQGLIKILTDNTLRKKMARQGWKTVQAYNWSRIARRIEDYYYKTLIQTSLQKLSL